MIEKTISIGPICADLKAKGEHEAAETIERIADSNAELGDNNIVLDRMVAELLDVLDKILAGGLPDNREEAEKVMARATGEME